MVMLLVMQSRDNAISFRARKRRFRGLPIGHRPEHRQAQPTYIDIGSGLPAGSPAHRWNRPEQHPQALERNSDNRAPTRRCRHRCGPDARRRGQDLNVYGYRNMMICDGSAMPANPASIPPDHHRPGGVRDDEDSGTKRRHDADHVLRAND